MVFKLKLSSILELAALLAAAIIIAIAISIGITAYLGGSSHPTVAVTTGSMLPIYNGFQDREIDDIYPFRGDILLVRKVPISSIQIGDVIVFDVSLVSDPVVHRVIDKWSENDTFFFKTNGDNRDDPDPWEVEGKNIFGVVVFRIPHVGWFLLLIQTTIGRLIILAMAILFLFLGDSEEEKPKNKKKTFLNRKKVYVLLIGLILAIFISTNFLSAFISSPSVELYSYNISTDTKQDKLTDSNILDPFRLTLPSSSYKWQQQEDTSYFYNFFPIKIEMRSGGIFNNIAEIEIKTQVNETIGIYKWTTVYNFIGYRTVEGGVIAILPGSGTFEANITLNVHSRGLFSTPIDPVTFIVILHIS